MFSPVLIKYEYAEVNAYSDDRVTASNNFKYPTFIDESVDYKYNELPQYWDHAQLSNEVQPKSEIEGQQNSYYHEENKSLVHMRNYIQTDTSYQVNREECANQMDQHCPEKNEKSQLPKSMQSATLTNQMVMISEPMSFIKESHPGRSSKNCPKLNTGKKLKCQCEICFKEFGHKSNLFVHMRTHNGEKPYKCNQCEKCFTHSGNLATHMRTHSGERPYGCQICGKMFSHSGNLSTHLRTHSGVKPYKCAVCSKEFRHSGNLSIHERIHSGVKPFQCKICGKDFYHSGNLTTHMKKHTININTNNTGQCKNNEKQTICTAVNLNDTISANLFSDLPLTTTNIKLESNVNSIVPIKNECSDEELTTAIEIATPTST